VSSAVHSAMYNTSKLAAVHITCTVVETG